MNSPKPPLQQLLYQGSPGKPPLFNKDLVAPHSPSLQSTSENWDPNLEKAAAAEFRKKDTAAASTLEHVTEKNQVISRDAREEATAGGDQGKQKDIPQKCGAGDGGVGQHQLPQFKSPTKPATATSPAHSHRQHICRSPRCASNNPDYATPAQVPPRKYLISKRHLLPGAICTRDPSTLPSSQIPLPPSSSTGKPPARPPAAPTASKPPTSNAFRQLSFKDDGSDTSKLAAGKAATCSRAQTNCGGPATVAACGRIAGSGPDWLARSQNEEQDGVVTASEAQRQDGIDRRENVSCDCSADDAGSFDEGQDALHPRTDVVTTSGTQVQEQRQQDGIDQKEPMIYDCLTAHESQDVEEEEEEEEEDDRIPELKLVGSELSSDLEHTSLTACAEDQIPGSLTSLEAERCESTDFAAEAGESSATAVPPPVYPNASEEAPEPVAAYTSIGCEVAHGFSSSLTESADNPPLDVENVAQTHEQSLALEEMDVTTSSRCQLSCDDGVVDIYDLAAATSTPGSREGNAGAGSDYILRDCSPEERRHVEENGEISRDDFEDKTSQDCQAEENFVFVENVDQNEDRSRESETNLCNSRLEPEVQRAPPRFGRSKGRQLWRNDCRDSREVVTLKPTNCNRQAKDWMVDSLLEGAVDRLKPSGEGRVRLLVEAFESLMNISEPEPEKRPSRVWCFNRMGRGEVTDEGDVCAEGDQRVDCYEVSGDRLELRASMRLSLGGSSRHEMCSVDEDEEMRSMQKVQEWDDRHASNPYETGEKKEADDGDQDREKRRRSTRHEGTTAKTPTNGPSTTMSDKDRKRVQMYHEVKKQLGYKTDDNVNMKIQRYNLQKGSFKSSSVKSDSESNLGSAEKSVRAGKNTNLEPFRLLTEERGALKEYQFARKLEQLFAEEERLRNPIAQGLPWTTDEPEVIPKPPVKQPTKHVDFTHYSNSRAAIRAEFDHYIAEREMYMKMQREEEERQRQIAEQEEIKRLRREMVPRAQLMPFFDQPFMPSRSSKRLTVPKEPNFKTREHKRAKCMVFQQGAT